MHKNKNNKQFEFTKEIVNPQSNLESSEKYLLHKWESDDHSVNFLAI